MVIQYIEETKEDFQSGEFTFVTVSGSRLESSVVGYTQNGLNTGMVDTDLVFYPNRSNGSSNDGEVDITGTYFVDSTGITRNVGDISSGLILQDSASNVGYIMYSVEDVFTRMNPWDSNAHHFLGVIYNEGEGQWYYDDNSDFQPFTTTSGDCLVAELKWGVDYVYPIYSTISGSRINQIKLESPEGSFLDSCVIDYSKMDGLVFNGTSSYVDLNDIGLSNYHHTVEVFGVFNSGAFFAKGEVGESEETNIVRYGIDETNFYCFYETSAGDNHSFEIILSKNYVDDSRHHIVVVVDLTTLYLYIDGLLEGSSEIYLLDSAAKEWIGYDGNNQYFEGMINEVRLWNKSRSLNEIKSTVSGVLNGDEEGLLAYYKFNEGQGTTLTDYSINEHHGTIANCLWTHIGVEVKTSEDSINWTDWVNIEPYQIITDTFKKDYYYFKYKQIFYTERCDSVCWLDEFSISSDNLFLFNGEVKVGSTLKSGIDIRLVNQNTHDLIDSCYSDDNGRFELLSNYQGNHYLISFPPSGSSYNAQILYGFDTTVSG